LTSIHLITRFEHAISHAMQAAASELVAFSAQVRGRCIALKVMRCRCMNLCNSTSFSLARRDYGSWALNQNPQTTLLICHGYWVLTCNENHFGRSTAAYLSRLSEVYQKNCSTTTPSFHIYSFGTKLSSCMGTEHSE
jgi:hypothetical protein